jgi:hypothetical protein
MEEAIGSAFTDRPVASSKQLLVLDIRRIFSQRTRDILPFESAHGFRRFCNLITSLGWIATSRGKDL